MQELSFWELLTERSFYGMGLLKQRFVIIQLALLFHNFLYMYYLSYFPLKFVFSF